MMTTTMTMAKVVIRRTNMILYGGYYPYMVLLLLIGGITKGTASFTHRQRLFARGSNSITSRSRNIVAPSSHQRLVTRMASTASSSDVPPSTTKDEHQDGHQDIRFGKFVIPAASVFYRSPTAQSFAFVNLRPLVPGHVLIVPHEMVPTMDQLSQDAYLDMWLTVRKVQEVLRQQYQGTSAFNVAVQDGRAAGQSVPHVHVHVLPRRAQGGDYYNDQNNNDQIYTDLEEWAPRSDLKGGHDDNDGSSSGLDVPDDSERRDRTPQEMADEAAMYRKILEELE